MEKRAFNWGFGFYMLFGVLAAVMAWGMFFWGGDCGGGIFFAAVSFAAFVLPGLFVPVGYRFDQEGITFCYLAVSNERYLWKNIRSIEVQYERNSANFFRLNARPEGESRFYMEGKVAKTPRTKRLLEQYWKGTITGYYLDDMKEWFSKRKRKKKNRCRQAGSNKKK